MKLTKSHLKQIIQEELRGGREWDAHEIPHASHWDWRQRHTRLQQEFGWSTSYILNFYQREKEVEAEEKAQAEDAQQAAKEAEAAEAERAAARHQPHRWPYVRDQDVVAEGEGKMKITKSELEEIMKEEIEALMNEKEDEEWIQGAEKDIEKRGTEGVCTGDKFGGPTCRPGTKRYNLAKTFRKMAKDRKKK